MVQDQGVPDTYTVLTGRTEGWWFSTVQEIPGFFDQTYRFEEIEPSVRSGLELFPEFESDPSSAIIDVVISPTWFIDEEDEEELRGRR